LARACICQVMGMSTGSGPKRFVSRGTVAAVRVAVIAPASGWGPKQQEHVTMRTKLSRGDVPSTELGSPIAGASALARGRLPEVNQKLVLAPVGWARLGFSPCWEPLVPSSAPQNKEQ